MTLRILMPVFNLIGKGTYWRAYGFAQELATRGYEVTLIGAGTLGMAHTEVKQTGGVQQVAIPSRFRATQGSGYDPGDILGRIRWMNQNQKRFDLAHAFESRPACLIPALMSQRRGALFISDWCDWFGRGGSVEQRTNPLTRTLLRPIETVLENKSRPRADGVTVINETLSRRAQSLGVASERILTLPNGAYTEAFAPGDRAAARRSLKLPLDAPLIAYTGALFESGAKLMAEAFDRIQESLPEARLLMIGYSNIDLKPWVHDPEAIINTGAVTFQELVDYVAASTIGWIPLADNLANAGRFPMKLNDFMASGRAVVVTDVGDLGAFVRERNVGLVAEPTADSLAQRVLELLGDADLRKEIEKQTRHVANTVFAWPIVTDRLEEFYRRLLAAQ